MLIPREFTESMAYVLEFKVHDPEEEETLCRKLYRRH